MARRWIQKALSRHPKGGLHRDLGVPLGQPIPTALVKEAAHHPERFKSTHAARLHLVRRANLALTLRGLKHHHGPLPRRRRRG